MRPDKSKTSRVLRATRIFYILGLVGLLAACAHAALVREDFSLAALYLLFFMLGVTSLLIRE